MNRMLKPAGHRILIKPDKIEEITKGGIIVPIEARENERRATMTGIVLAIGPDAWKGFADGKPWAKPGDRVLFSRYAGIDLTRDLRMEIAPESERLTIMNDEDIVMSSM